MYSKLLAGLKPYKAGEQPQDKKYIKLNTNESPFAPGKKTLAAIAGARNLSLYPDPECMDLRKAVSDKYGIGIERIFAGNGSDEVLAFCFGVLFDSNSRIIFPDITYSFYPVYCSLYGIPYDTVLLDEGYRINVNGYNGAGARGIIIANPNAPTGIALKKEKIMDIVRADNNRIVIVDEAYADFCNESVIGECAGHDNLIVVRTFSKAYSLAGARVGFAVANPDIIEKINIYKNSFNSYTVGTLNQALATAALKDSAYYEANAAEIIRVRGETVSGLNKLGYESLESGANFIFAKCPKGGQYTYARLKDAGFLVRFFPGERTDSYIRITIGTEQDMKAFVDAAGKI